MPTEIKRSVCPYDCPDTCGLLVEVADGKAVKVSGDPDHPFTRGTLCPKMNHYERTVHSPLRLTTPLLRSGPKGSGQFRTASWKEAIRQIADRWRKIIGRYWGGGHSSLLLCRNHGSYPAQFRPSLLLPFGRFPAGPHDLRSSQGGRLEGGDGKHSRTSSR